MFTNINQNVNKSFLKQQHTNGPLMDIITGPQYCVLSFNNINIKIKLNKDSYILTKYRKNVKCINIAHRNGEPVLIVKYFKFMFALFDYPIYLTISDIFIVGNLVKKLNYSKY